MVHFHTGSDVGIESRAVSKRLHEIDYARRIPSADVSSEDIAASERCAHIFNARGIPQTDAQSLEGPAILKHMRHIRHRRHVPRADALASV